MAWHCAVSLDSCRCRATLRSATGPCIAGCDYDTEHEGVSVRYSGERCATGDGNPLNVPPNTVISVTVYPAVKPRLSDLKLSMRKFTRTKDPELNGYSTHTNEETGVTYEVSDKDRVLSIEWFGSSRDIRISRCPSTRCKTRIVASV
jgi:hypothetical protein